MSMTAASTVLSDRAKMQNADQLGTTTHQWFPIQGLSQSQFSGDERLATTYLLQSMKPKLMEIVEVYTMFDHVAIKVPERRLWVSIIEALVASLGGQPSSSQLACRGQTP